jgi:hypothetical protein
VKALSLTQPFATLVATGEKKIETRSWSTSYRGPIAIHAAKGLSSIGGMGGLIDLCTTEPFRSVLTESGRGQGESKDLPLHVIVATLPRGAVVATARLVDCLPISDKPIKGQHCIAPDGKDPLIRVWHPTEWGGVKGHYSDITTEHDLSFGDYTPGRFGWVLDDIEPLREPVPARGSLGLWTIDDSLLQAGIHL